MTALAASLARNRITSANSCGATHLEKSAFGMLALNGLPSLYHPLFNAPNFRDGASTDQFFLCLEALDPKFDTAETRTYLQSFGPASVVEVEY